METLYIVMPAYNEEANIKDVVAAWYTLLEGKSEFSRLVVADGGSNDSTHSILMELQGGYPKLEVLEGTGKQHGEKLIALYDYALRSGADYIFQTDSDGQTNPMEFCAFWEQRTEYDGIFGNRTERGDGKIRAFVEKVVCLILRLFFGVIVPDANAPFRLMKAETIKKYLYKLPSNYNIPNIMITAYYAFYGEKMRFCKVTFKPRQGGVNSINIPRIIGIGRKALKDFSQFRKEMNGEVERGRIVCSGADKCAKILVTLFLFSVAFIFLMQSPLNIWVRNGNAGTDSSVYKTIAMYMQNGLMPYRDSFDHKGPLLYIYNWLGLQIKYWRGIWMIEFVSLFLCVTLLYKLARLTCGRLYACLTVLVVTAPLYAYFEGGNLTEEYAMPYITGALYIFADYFLNEEINKVRLIVCGMAFGAVCMLRINMISLWVVFCVTVLIQCILKKQLQSVWGFLGWFMFGVSIVIAPILVWLTVNGALGDFIHDYFIFNLLYVNDGNRANSLNKYNVFSYFLNNSYVLIAGIISIYICRMKKDIFHFSYCASIFITLFFICLSGMTHKHYGMVLIPMLVYPISMLLSEMEKEKHLALFSLVIYILAMQVLPSWIGGLNCAVTCFYNQNNNINRTDTVGKMVNFVKNNSEKEDRIIIWGNWNIIYVLSGRMPASKYSYQFPIGRIDNCIMNEFFEEIGREKPKMIIVPKDRALEEMEGFILSNNYLNVKEIDGSVIYMME